MGAIVVQCTRTFVPKPGDPRHKPHLHKRQPMDRTLDQTKRTHRALLPGSLGCLGMPARSRSPSDAPAVPQSPNLQSTCTLATLRAPISVQPAVGAQTPRSHIQSHLGNLGNLGNLARPQIPRSQIRGACFSSRGHALSPRLGGALQTNGRYRTLPLDRPCGRGLEQRNTRPQTETHPIRGHY